MQSEDRLQQECYMWFHNTYPELRGLLFHVPNGGNRNAIEGKKFKLIGVVSGVSDLLFLYKGKTYCFELKKISGYQSNNQLKWQNTVENQGFKYYIVRDVVLFKNLIKNIIDAN
jgi:hypothetical protein